MYVYITVFQQVRVKCALALPSISECTTVLEKKKEKSR